MSNFDLIASNLNGKRWHDINYRQKRSIAIYSKNLVFYYFFNYSAKRTRATRIEHFSFN